MIKIPSTYTPEEAMEAHGNDMKDPNSRTFKASGRILGLYHVPMLIAAERHLGKDEYNKQMVAWLRDGSIVAQWNIWLAYLKSMEGDFNYSRFSPM